MAKGKRPQQRARRTGASGASSAGGVKPTVRPAAQVAPTPAVSAPTFWKAWARRNRGTLLIAGGFVVLIAVLIGFARAQNQQASVDIGKPVPADVLREVTTVSPSVAETVGSGGVKSVMQATPKGTALLMANGKPEVIYVGGDYCPYCAATRWSTVVALSRFGSFGGLTLMRSSSTDVYPDTATFTFSKVTYTSQYITFNATETADRDGAPLKQPSGSSARALATYDAAPYTSTASGVPFMDYGDQYVMTSGLFVPTMLQGLTWQQIAAQLSNPNSDVTKAIVGGANQQTAAICKLTNDQPGSVCSTTTIQQLEAALPQPK